MVQRDPQARNSHQLTKAATGIRGFDEITEGGLPKGRPSLVVGGPGCGKTVFGMQFLAHGAEEYDEPGVFISFEVSAEHLLKDFNSMDMDLDKLIEENKIRIVHFDLGETEVFQTGSFSLEGIKIAISQAVKATGAKRIVLDTLEKFYDILPKSRTLRLELGNLFNWLKGQDLTTIITGEQGDQTLTERGFEAYLSDCVVLLDHRIENQISKRRLRVIKYRGSQHGRDEYPFVIGSDGIWVFPITSATLDYPITDERISTGISGLDDMFGGKGYFRQSTILLVGKSGTGKSTLAASFAEAACERGESVCYFTFEESPSQVTRNMKSVGIDFEPYLEKGNLKLLAFRPSFRGLEEHLIFLQKTIADFQPTVVVLDPITSFIDIGSLIQVKSMIARFIDLLKKNKITILMTVLVTGSDSPEESEVGISSLMDTWIAIDYLMIDGIREKSLFVVKSRGMDHSRRMHLLDISSDEISVEPVQC
ncbi:circadian clock protein KaiC [bacterium]|nr:circadian clock protein KaiC [bacterium]